jgi:hypothetical protein
MGLPTNGAGATPSSPPAAPGKSADMNEQLSQAATSETAESAPTESQLLARFQQAMTSGGSGGAPAPDQRKSRREQLAQVAEQPFVRRAMELFDVQPGQFRYSPPEGETT